MSNDTNAAPSESGWRERKRQLTLDRLADTAYRLFAAHGYEAVAMEQIAAEADVAKATLYKHFPVKEALLARRFHRELAEDLGGLREAIAAQPRFAAQMRCLLDASADWFSAHRPYLAPYLRYRLGQVGAESEQAHSGLDRVFAALIGAAQHAGELRPVPDAAHLAQLFQFLYLGALLRWLAQPDGELRSEFDAVLTLFLHGQAVHDKDAR